MSLNTPYVVSLICTGRCRENQPCDKVYLHLFLNVYAGGVLLKHLFCKYSTQGKYENFRSSHKRGMKTRSMYIPYKRNPLLTSNIIVLFFHVHHVIFL